MVSIKLFSLLEGLLLLLSSCRTIFGQVELPELNYTLDALEPYITETTVTTHYTKHHQAYVSNANSFIEEHPKLQGLSLEKLVRKTDGTIFNNVGQIYNHNLYWKSLSPYGGGEPTGGLYDAIIDGFGSYEDFQVAFTTAASSHFGSGWAWVIMHKDGSVSVADTHDAENPISLKLGFPLLVCDVWEHAYYLDHKNLRADYIGSWWELVNWEHAEFEYDRIMANSDGKKRGDKEGSRKKRGGKKGGRKNRGGNERGGKEGEGKERGGKGGERKERDGKEGERKERGGREGERKERDGKEGKRKERGSKEGGGREGERRERDGKEGERKERDGKEGERKEGGGKEGERKERGGKEGGSKEGERKERDGREGERKERGGKDGERKEGEHKDGDGKEGERKGCDGKEGERKERDGKEGEGKERGDKE